MKIQRILSTVAICTLLTTQITAALPATSSQVTLVKRINNAATLHEAVAIGDVDTVRHILGQDTDVNSVDDVGSTPLIAAAYFGQTEVAKLLLDQGANVNAATRFGETALHHAAMNDHVEIVGLLLASGANIEAADEEGQTPVDLAVRYKHNDVVELLLASSIQCPNDVSLAHFAAATGNVDVLQTLMEMDHEYMTKPDAQGKTPLENAYENVQIGTIRFLNHKLQDSTMPSEDLHRIVMNVLEQSDQEKVERMLLNAHRYDIVLNHDLSNEQNTVLATCVAENNLKCARNLIIAAMKNHAIPLDPNAPFIDPTDRSIRIHLLDYVMNRLKSEFLTQLFMIGTKDLSRYLDLNVQDETTGRTAFMNTLDSDNVRMAKLFADIAIQHRLYLDTQLTDKQGCDSGTHAILNPPMWGFWKDYAQALGNLKRNKPMEFVAPLDAPGTALGSAVKKPSGRSKRVHFRKAEEGTLGTCDVCRLDSNSVEDAWAHDVLGKIERKEAPYDSFNACLCPDHQKQLDDRQLSVNSYADSVQPVAR